MFEMLIIFILLVLVKRSYNITLVKHLHDGYYVYYEVKEFDVWYKNFNPRVKKILIWNLKSRGYEEDHFF